MREITFEEHCLNYKGCQLRLSYFIRHRSRKTLLYLHGLGSSKRDFISAIYRKEFQEYTIVAFDFPGCGNTNYPVEASLDVNDLVEITQKFISDLGLDQLIIIGHSMGGLIGLLLSNKYGNTVKGFINIEGNLAPEDCFLTREVVQYDYESFVNNKFLEKLKWKLARSEYKGVRIYSDNFQKQVMERAFFDYSHSIVNYSDNFKLKSLFSNLQIPLFFIYGSANNHLSYLSELIKSNVFVKEIPDSHHWIFYDNPTFSYKVLAEFLN
jgi:pimeloyl-ACP methyl ester carboxylesterase